MFCLYLKFRYRKELYALVFNEFIPDIGQIITDANGTELMIVEKGKRDGNTWVARGYIIYVERQVVPASSIELDFIDDGFPTGYPVMMNNHMWIKLETGEFAMQFEGEKITA